jgi:hypothetical protein
MDSVISGIDSSHPTRIYGENAENGCATKTELYADRLLTSGIKLTDTNNAEIKCIELTDHSTNNVVPYVNGSLMSNGIYAEDSSSILLENVSIHGVRKGILAGRLSNWTLKSVDLLRNMSAGWDGDIGHTAPNDSNNSGDMIFNNVKIQYNGCNEIYPDNKPVFCASQSQGGYGDGLGTYKTGGNWYFTDCDFSHNTSDGLDLLYHTGDGNIYIKNSRFEGNAGNPLKLAALNDYVENSKVIANCGYFKDQSFTSTVHVTTGNPTGFDNCRAGAQALALILRENSQHKIYNSTILGDGGILFYTQGTGCNGTERVVARNNIYVGGPAFLDQTKDTDIFYAGGSDGDCGNPACCFSGQFDNDYAVEYGMKDPCQSTSNYFCESPDFIDTTDLGFYTGEEQNVGLQVTSPAIAEGNTSIVCTYGDCGEDFYHNDRASSWDLGALQYGSSSSSCTTVPSLCLDQYTCEVAGWNWWSTQVCMATAEPNPCASTCSECATQLACEGSAAGCYYYDSSCHATPQSTCDDDCSICSTDEQCTLSDVVGGCHWVVQGPGVGSCLAGPAGAEGENCDTNCLACVTQETCLASPLGCSYWTDGQCRNVSQNCDNDCSSCVTPATCSASLSHCIYYRDGSCNPENEPLESLGATTVNFSGGTLNGLNIR